MNKITTYTTILILITLISTGCSKGVKEKGHISGGFVLTSIRDGAHGVFLYEDDKMTLLGRKMSMPVWSPDGKTIAVGGASQDSYEECKIIYLFDEYGNKIRDIDTPVGVKSLDWFPDGKKIVYVGYPSRVVNKFDPYLIYLYDLETDTHKRIYEGEKTDEYVGIRCSPKGDKIVFDNLTDGDREGVYIIDADGSNIERMSRNALKPSWFPDGENICIWAGLDADGKWLVEKGEGNCYFRYNLKTKEYTKILQGQGFTWGDKLSRDGKYLYFARQQQGGRVINVVPLDGPDKGKSFPIIPDGKIAYDGYPDWYQG